MLFRSKIARRGLHVYREYGVDPLERHFVSEVMTADAVTIPADMPVPEVQARYFGAGQKHRAYPVVDDGHLLGMIVRDDLPPDVVQDEAQPVGELLQDRKSTRLHSSHSCAYRMPFPA